MSYWTVRAKMPKYEVQVRVGGYATYIVEAQDKQEAGEKAVKGEGAFMGVEYDAVSLVLSTSEMRTPPEDAAPCSSETTNHSPPLPDEGDPDSLRYVTGKGDWWCRGEACWLWWDARDQQWKPALHGPD